MIPSRLHSGDTVRIIAPSRSLSIIGKESREIAKSRFDELELTLTFGKHVEESDDFTSSSIQSRIEDLHAAFLDPNVKAILTVIGGFNSNQLLQYIDWNIIKNNPKIFCGYSDITALNNAFFAKTGLVTYSGPHYSTFGQKLYLEYTLEYFKKCLMQNNAFKILSSSKWSDDEWYIDQSDRKLISNKGYFVIQEGDAEGTVLGGNLCTFNLLQGTEYFPKIESTILFIEDDYTSEPHTFDRDLQSLIHQPEFKNVRGIVIGRFQKKSNMTNDLLSQIIKTKKELKNLPIVATVDFGHTDPKITIPIGGTVRIQSSAKNTFIKFTEH
ncbi:MAG: LD-carboxypeptidase [Candidatus Levybacteria bacterium]|nr:LD-carboxypeptidase [Candidatus Levybacteria bacterium]